MKEDKDKNKELQDLKGKFLDFLYDRKCPKIQLPAELRVAIEQLALNCKNSEDCPFDDLPIEKGKNNTIIVTKKPAKNSSDNNNNNDDDNLPAIKKAIKMSEEQLTKENNNQDKEKSKNDIHDRMVSANFLCFVLQEKERREKERREKERREKERRMSRYRGNDMER